MRDGVKEGVKEGGREGGREEGFTRQDGTDCYYI